MSGDEPPSSPLLSRMATPQYSAKIFTGLIMLVCAFQFALALGAPWGRFAMGGIYPRAYPAGMRVAALAQVGLLAAAAFVVLSRAGLAWPSGHRRSRWLIWVITGALLLGCGLNLMSPSEGERLLWSPVALVLFLSAARVALSR